MKMNTNCFGMSWHTGSIAGAYNANILAKVVQMHAPSLSQSLFCILFVIFLSVFVFVFVFVFSNEVQIHSISKPIFFFCSICS